MNPQDKKYPIKPKHLDTSERPKGFDHILEHSQITLLWCVVELFKHRGVWGSFTSDEFQEYIDGPGKDTAARRIGPLLHFFEPKLSALMDSEYVDKVDHDWKKGHIYSPNHFLISTYFMWNRVK